MLTPCAARHAVLSAAACRILSLVGPGGEVVASINTRPFGIAVESDPEEGDNYLNVESDKEEAEERENYLTLEAGLADEELAEETNNYLDVESQPAPELYSLPQDSVSQAPAEYATPNPPLPAEYDNRDLNTEEAVYAIAREPGQHHARSDAPVPVQRQYHEASDPGMGFNPFDDEGGGYAMVSHVNNPFHPANADPHEDLYSDTEDAAPLAQVEYAVPSKRPATQAPLLPERGYGPNTVNPFADSFSEEPDVLTKPLPATAGTSPLASTDAFTRRVSAIFSAADQTDGAKTAMNLGPNASLDRTELQHRLDYVMLGSLLTDYGLLAAFRQGSNGRVDFSDLLTKLDLNQDGKISLQEWVDGFVAMRARIGQSLEETQGIPTLSEPAAWPDDRMSFAPSEASGLTGAGGTEMEVAAAADRIMPIPLSRNRTQALDKELVPVTIRKSIGDAMGIEIYGGVETGNSGIYISEVAPFSPADGKLMPHDEIVAVGSKEFRPLSRNEAKDVLLETNGQSVIELLVCRKKGTAPSKPKENPKGDVRGTKDVGRGLFILDKPLRKRRESEKLSAMTTEANPHTSQNPFAATVNPDNFKA